MRRLQKRKKREFSKTVLGFVMLSYFFGIAVATLIVLTTAPDQLGALLAFIGAPVATAIAFYYWKAKNENIHKNPDIEPAPPVAEPPENPAEPEREDFL